MKTIKTFAAAIATATVSFTTFAAEHVSAGMPPNSKSRRDRRQRRNRPEQPEVLAADAAGAKAFTITSTSGNNLMHATAVIYK